MKFCVYQVLRDTCWFSVLCKLGLEVLLCRYLCMFSLSLSLSLSVSLSLSLALFLSLFPLSPPPHPIPNICRPTPLPFSVSITDFLWIFNDSKQVIQKSGSMLWSFVDGTRIIQGWFIKHCWDCKTCEFFICYRVVKVCLESSKRVYTTFWWELMWLLVGWILSRLVCVMCELIMESEKRCW